jgi:hypothetical protein
MDRKKMSLIKRRLERKTCTECNKHPKISIAGNKFNVKCCCPAFQSKISALAKRELAILRRQSAEDKNES